MNMRRVRVVCQNGSEDPHGVANKRDLNRIYLRLGSYSDSKDQPIPDYSREKTRVTENSLSGDCASADSGDRRSVLASLYADR